MLTSRPSIQQKASLDLDCIPEVELIIAFVVFYILGFFLFISFLTNLRCWNKLELYSF